MEGKRVGVRSSVRSITYVYYTCRRSYMNNGSTCTFSLHPHYEHEIELLRMDFDHRESYKREGRVGSGGEAAKMIYCYVVLQNHV